MSACNQKETHSDPMQRALVSVYHAPLGRINPSQVVVSCICSQFKSDDGDFSFCKANANLFPRNCMFVYLLCTLKPNMIKNKLAMTVEVLVCRAVHVFYRHRCNAQLVTYSRYWPCICRNKNIIHVDVVQQIQIAVSKRNQQM